MNTSKTTPKAITGNVLGAFLVTLALVLGAGFGNLLNPDTPAQATNTTEAPADAPSQTTCTGFCDNSVGGGGNQPGPMTGTVMVGNGN